MKASDLMGYLKTNFPSIKFYNNSIDRVEKQCVGVYIRGSAPANVAIGGVALTSYTYMPCSILVHWTESAEQCQVQAQALYDFLKWKSQVTIGGKRVSSIMMKEPAPVFVGREGNIVEMTFNFNMVYDL